MKCWSRRSLIRLSLPMTSRYDSFFKRLSLRIDASSQELSVDKNLPRDRARYIRVDALVLHQSYALCYRQDFTAGATAVLEFYQKWVTRGAHSQWRCRKSRFPIFECGIGNHRVNQPSPSERHVRDREPTTPWKDCLLGYCCPLRPR